jgi:hypothetical protein
MSKKLKLNHLRLEGAAVLAAKTRRRFPAVLRAVFLPPFCRTSAGFDLSRPLLDIPLARQRMG